MRSFTLFLVSAWTASAFPGMPRREEMARSLHEGRDLLGTASDVVDSATANTQSGGSLLDTVSETVATLTNTVEGLLGSVAEGLLNPDNKRPEKDYPFIAPGPGDSRGPCPGLNLLANHGYLPRNGTVNFGQVVEATARGFNMGPDLASVLCTFAVITDGDIVTESWNLGEGFGKLGGLNRHSTVEADISPGREDFYNGCGDNHDLSSRIVKQAVELVGQSPSKTFDMQVMGEHFAKLAAFSRENNPYLYYFPFPSIVSFVAFSFYPAFFSNGTYGLGGVANYESITSIIGAKYDEKTGDFMYVPERYPEQGWYRRAYPYTAPQALADGLVNIYAKYPVPMPIAQLGTDNLNATTILCDLYMGLNSITPLGLAGTAEEIEARVTWAIAKLDPYFKDTILGCPTNAISNNFLFPNQNGGNLQPPPSVLKNTGDNVYNKVYFKEAPVTPNCNPTA